MEALTQTPEELELPEEESEEAFPDDVMFEEAVLTEKNAGKRRKPIRPELIMAIIAAACALLLAGVLYVPLKRFYAGQDLVK